MSKIRKSCTNITVRVIPSERKAVEQLADRLGCNISNVIKYSLYETLQKANIPFVDFQLVNQSSDKDNNAANRS